MSKIPFDYKQAIRVLRKYAYGFDAKDGYGLNIDLTPSRKARIKRYWNSLKRMTNTPNQILRPRSSEHLQALKRSAANPTNNSFRVVFYPVQGGERISRIEWRRGYPIIHYARNDIIRIFIPVLDHVAFSLDPVEESIRLMKIAPDATFYRYRFGMSESNYFQDQPIDMARGTLRDYWNMMLAKYGDLSYVTGINAYDLPKGISASQFRNRQRLETNDYREDLKKRRIKKKYLDPHDRY